MTIILHLLWMNNEEYMNVVSCGKLSQFGHYCILQIKFTIAVSLL